uniref:Serine racemase n=1 Tax=Vombatus ursinus TaxID=29139 RepID=A0A4X2KJJ9_VOMUR
MCSQYCISLADVKKAHSNIEDLVHITPILTSSILNQLAGRKLFFKCELFQKTGSFKIRGALNAIQGLTFSPSDGKKPKAVVTHSSGNHGQALSYAAKLKGIPAYIVVPRTAPSCKKSAIQGYGATIIDCEPSDESRTTVAARIVKQTEGTMVHPNQCPAVMAGQGTIALEVLEQVPAVDALVVPVGGGGMISGIAVTVKALRPEVKVYAAEPCNADDCFQSKLKGELTPNPSPPVTIADGVKSSIGPNTWPIIRDLVDEVFTVTEDEIKGHQGPRNGPGAQHPPLAAADLQCAGSTEARPGSAGNHNGRSSPLWISRAPGYQGVSSPPYSALTSARSGKKTCCQR